MAKSFQSVSLKRVLASRFQDAIAAAFPQIPRQEAKVVPAQPKFGDYQCSNAMDLYSQYGPKKPAKDKKGKKKKEGEEEAAPEPPKEEAPPPPDMTHMIGGAQTPKAVADKIKEAIDGQADSIFENVSVAPQGFITVKMSTDWVKKTAIDSYLAQTGLAVGCTFDQENEKTGKASGVKVPQHVVYTPEEGAKKVVVDFSSPNIAKDMHVGHLRSTIIGESLCRVLEFAGHDVVRLNHVGDWGTQFGMLIEYMKETYPNFLDNMPDISDLQTFYKASKKRFDDDEDFKKRSQLGVVALQGGEEYARKCWQAICEVSRKMFNQVYDRLDVDVEERGESFYNEYIPGIIKDLKEKGVVVESQGAQVIHVPKVSKEVPFLVQKSDGGYGYGSTDLACVWHRTQELKADWIVYVTDIGQELHFHSLFEAATQIGWHAPPKTRIDHMGFGLVCGDDGKKFKTRSGDTVKLADLLDEAVTRAKAELEKRRDEIMSKAADTAGDAGDVPDSKGLAGTYNVEEAARRIGFAAVKYADLKNQRIKNYNFSYDRALDPRGDTAVYLLYAYARVCSIQEKCGVNRQTGAGFPDMAAFDFKQPVEREIVIHLIKFPDMLDIVLKELELHHICAYAYQLCNLLSNFYNLKECKVLGSEEQGSRLLLLEMVRRVLGKCLYLLGCKPLEKML